VELKPVNDSHCFLLNITDDDIPEDTEEFTVTLNIGVNDDILSKSVILGPRVLTVRIIDNDGEYYAILHSHEQYDIRRIANILDNADFSCNML